MKQHYKLFDLNKANKNRDEYIYFFERNLRTKYKEIYYKIKPYLDKLKEIDSELNYFEFDEFRNKANDLYNKLAEEQYLELRKALIIVSIIFYSSYGEFLESLGLKRTRKYNLKPERIANRVASGVLYGATYSHTHNLSSIIWGNSRDTLNNIERIINDGIRNNRSVVEIAKMLEGYVSPDARKPWDWKKKVYPILNDSYRKIDYNAARLARTALIHSYQESFKEAGRENPFIKYYIWEASGSERMCEICSDLDGQSFKKDELPLEHPNGMCTWTYDFDASFDEIAEKIADWYDSDEGTYPEIDEFSKNL